MNNQHYLSILVAGLFLLGGVTAGDTAPVALNTKFDHHLVEVLADEPSGDVPVIVTTLGAPQAARDAAALLGAEIIWTYDLIDGFAAQAPAAVLDALALRDDVDGIWLDRPITTVMDVSHRAIEADKVWASGYDGAGITVAVIDTGIDMLHPFFSGAIVACVSTIGGLVSPECTDSDGHGTHVAGTVASRDDRYVGVAPGASLAAVRVLHAVGAGTSSDIIAGMNWVKNNQNNVNPPIRVATMSIGFLNPGCGDGTGPEADAANALVDSGVFFSVAAGNSGHKDCTIDGASAAAKVTTIAAVDDMGTVTQDDDVIADFSSGGGNKLQKPDVSFPGVDITSAYIGAGVLIATLSGTSMATPHAAGTAALILDEDPSLSAQQVKDRMTGTAVKTANTGNSWNSVYGHGLGNACQAVNACSGGGGGGNSAPTASFTYDCTDLTCTFDASASSDSDGTIASYAWDFGDGNSGSGVTATHTYAADGTYSVLLTVTDDAGATGSTSESVSVADTGGSGITLSANGYKVKGGHHVDLSWNGATSTQMDVYRDGTKITTTANDGAYTDAIGKKGGGSYTHKICEAGTTVCSNSVTTTF